MPSTPRRPVWSSSSHRRRPRRSRATSARGTSWRRACGHVRDLPRNAADVPAKYKGEPWARLGVDVDNGFAALYVVSPGPQAADHQAARRWSRRSTSSCSPRMRTARARRSPGTWSRRSSPRCRSSGWSSTRSPSRPSRPRWPTRATSTATWSTRRRPAASSTGCTGTRSRPVLWKKVMPRPVRRPGAVGGDPHRGRARAAADGVPLRRVLGHPGHAGGRQGGPATGPRTFSATLIALDGDRIATGKDFEPTTGQVRPGAGVVHLDERRRPRAGRPPRRAGRSRSPGSRRSRTGAGRTRRSSPRRCSRRRPASCGSPRSRRCASRSGCTRTATSPICVPTR